jgi:L-lactate dehydrogenase complex protein LldE
VQFFATCLVDALYPDVGDAVETVLGKLGYEVEFREAQTCCGLPLYNNGFVEEARVAARQTLRVMKGEDPVVVPSGSCGWMMRKIYPTLILTAEARRFAERVKEFSELVAATGVKFRLPEKKRVTYHPSCHLLRGLHLREPPKTLLDNTVPLEVAPLERAEECCGFGGTFSVRYGQVSSAMLDDKLENASKTGAEVLLVTDAGCMLQIDGGARKRGCSFQVRHVAELLAAAEPVPDPSHVDTILRSEATVSEDAALPRRERINST